MRSDGYVDGKPCSEACSLLKCKGFMAALTAVGGAFIALLIPDTYQNIMYREARTYVYKVFYPHERFRS